MFGGNKKKKQKKTREKAFFFLLCKKKVFNVSKLICYYYKNFVVARKRLCVKVEKIHQIIIVNLIILNCSIDGVFAAETVDLGSISGRVKLRTIKIVILSFSAGRSEIKVKSLHRVW